MIKIILRLNAEIEEKNFLAGVQSESEENLIKFVEYKIKDELENKTQLFATKADISMLEVRIERSKAEIVKWMFIFWIGQMVGLFGLILLFVRK